jgi:hypothetical protein
MPSYDQPIDILANRFLSNTKHAPLRRRHALKNAVNAAGDGGLASAKVSHRVCGDPWRRPVSAIAGRGW